jgi:hypothetical protein
MDIGVLTVVTLALAALATHASIRAVRGRHRPDGRTLRAWWAGLLLVATIAAGSVEANHHQRQALVTQGMRAVTDNPEARANCERFSESLFNLSQFDGYVYQATSDVANYKRASCIDLASYARGSKSQPTLDQVAAVHLVAHETMHVNGVWNEAEAECTAAQLSHLVAEELGATPAQARELQARYFAEIYPNLRPNYVSAECREGGELDIFPERTEFP